MPLAMRPAVLVLCAVLGTLAGQFVTALRARADCAGPSWSLQLREVTSSDPASSHRSLWPERATLRSTMDFATIDSSETTKVNGVVRYLLAKP